MTENSIVLNLILRALGGISDAFLNSAIISAFLRPKNSTAAATGSIFYRIYNFIRKTGVKIFSVLHLDKLLTGSIFKTPYLWCFLAITASPFLPTMAVLALVLMSFLSLV